MHLFVLFVFIFGMGAMFGWGLEVIYRHVADPEKRWFNPGFCVGPWLPIYGIGLLTVFLVTYLEKILPIENIALKRIVLFVLMSLIMTLIELIGGEILLKYFNLRLWDYSNEKFNYKGFICLKFSIFWGLLSAGYYFLIHPLVYDACLWLSKNLIFCFFVGMFMSLFITDFIYSGHLVAKIRDYAKESGVIVKLEELKEKYNAERVKYESKPAFFLFMIKENINTIIARTKDKVGQLEINR